MFVNSQYRKNNYYKYNKDFRSFTTIYGDIEFERYYYALLDYHKFAENYKAALRNEASAKDLLVRSEEALSKAKSTYEELSTMLAEYSYDMPIPDHPGEPEITEETYEETNTTNISQTIKNIFAGISAVVEANITTKTTKVVKTIKDAATNVTKTVVTTSVNIVGSGTLKLYNRFGRLVSTISGNIDMVLSWVGGLLS